MTQSGSIWDELERVRISLEANIDRLDGVLLELNAHFRALDARLTEHEKHPVESKSVQRRKAVQKKAAK